MKNNVDINMVKKKNLLNIYDFWPLMASLIITIIVFRKVIFSGFMSLVPGSDSYCGILSWSYYYDDRKLHFSKMYIHYTGKF